MNSDEDDGDDDEDATFIEVDYNIDVHKKFNLSINWEERKQQQKILHNSEAF